MTPEAMLMTAIPVSVAVFYAVRWVIREPVDPDPWDGELGEEEAEEVEVPACTKCLAPIADASQHYCPKCGHATGEFTPYIPFVNIRFNYSLFATLWRRLRDPKAPLTSKLVPAFAILLTTPFILVLGLPFLIYGWLTKKPVE